MSGSSGLSVGEFGIRCCILFALLLGVTTGNGSSERMHRSPSPTVPVYWITVFPWREYWMKEQRERVVGSMHVGWGIRREVKRCMEGGSMGTDLLGKRVLGEEWGDMLKLREAGVGGLG
jgi:hypothetical protein